MIYIMYVCSIICVYITHMRMCQSRNKWLVCQHNAYLKNKQEIGRPLVYAVSFRVNSKWLS